MSRCVILGAAPFSDASILASYICDEDYIIAADGGQRLATALGVEPDRIIGDFDSSDQPLSHKRCTILPVKKDDTDVLAAVRRALADGYREFVLLGCLGGRLDHTLANVDVLLFLDDHDAVGLLADETHELSLLSAGEHTVASRADRMLSLFPVGGDATGVTIKHTLYETENAAFTAGFPIGVSNEFTDRAATISLKSGRLLMILAQKDSP